jgi:S-DNA-T family DNA segregation ATPase FtsK/SpoIIIE
MLGSSFLQVPLGWVDKPFDQTRDLLTINMSGAAGNVAIVGGPQSGKSTALRSLLCGLALTHTPAELQLYCLDFGGGSLSSLADLPHVGVVAGRLQPELVRRTVAMVNRILNKREQAFTAAGIGSLAEWREQVAARTVIGDEFGDVILVVDGWGALREFFEPLEAQLTSLATRGLNYGVHLAVTAGRWPEIRAALKDMIGSRIELRLGDPLDSEINAKFAAGVPEGRPGRGLSRDRLHLLTAVPRIDGNPSSDGLAAATTDLFERSPPDGRDHRRRGSSCCRQSFGPQICPLTSIRRSGTRSVSTRSWSPCCGIRRPTSTCCSSANSSRANRPCCAT